MPQPSVADAPPEEPLPGIDLDALVKRGELAAWHGLRRGAEDWHPEVRRKATTLKDLRKAEHRLEIGVRKWFREVQDWLKADLDAIILEPETLDVLDWEQWERRFAQLTSGAFEKILEIGGEDSKVELRGALQETGTAQQSLRRASDTGISNQEYAVASSPPPALRSRLPFVRAAEPAIDVSWDIGSEQAQEWLRAHPVELATGLSQTTRTRMAATLARARAEGLGIPETAARVNRQFGGMTSYRSRLIAQTETIRAYNQGALQVYRDAKVERKQWLDGQAGADQICLDLDGEIVKLDEQFSNGEDAPPAHPGCRCAVRAVIASGVSGGSSTNTQGTANDLETWISSPSASSQPGSISVDLFQRALDPSAKSFVVRDSDGIVQAFAALVKPQGFASPTLGFEEPHEFIMGTAPWNIGARTPFVRQAAQGLIAEARKSGVPGLIAENTSVRSLEIAKSLGFIETRIELVPGIKKPRTHSFLIFDRDLRREMIDEGLI